MVRSNQNSPSKKSRKSSNIIDEIEDLINTDFDIEECTSLQSNYTRELRLKEAIKNKKAFDKWVVTRSKPRTNKSQAKHSYHKRSRLNSYDMKYNRASSFVSTRSYKSNLHQRVKSSLADRWIQLAKDHNLYPSSKRCMSAVAKYPDYKYKESSKSVLTGTFIDNTESVGKHSGLGSYTSKFITREKCKWDSSPRECKCKPTSVHFNPSTKRVKPLPEKLKLHAMLNVEFTMEDCAQNTLKSEKLNEVGEESEIETVLSVMKQLRQPEKNPEVPLNIFI